MIKPRKKKIAVKRIVVYDLEWYPKTYKFRLGGLYDGETYQSFQTVGELLDAICVSENRGAYIYAHAGGLSDVQFLLKEIVAGHSSRFRVEAAFSGASAIIVRLIDEHNHTWTLIDSLWTLRTSLRKIGESIGLHKTGEWTCPDKPHCGHEEGHCIFYAPMPVLRDYNERDCVVLWKALERLQQGMLALGGELKPTAASCALGLFLRKYLMGPIRTCDAVNRASRDSYTASRVEVFRREAGPGVTFFDINSSFPYSMTKPFPGDLLGHARRWHEDDDLALVRAEVVVPPMYVPPLPFRATDGHVYHPCGRWESSFFGVDLQALLAVGGRIEKVKWCMRFEARTDLADYVWKLYEMRRVETDPFQRDLIKLLLNSLYGKFAEREEKQKLFVRPTSVPDGAKAVMPGVYIADVSRAVPHAHVAASAVITARSRQLLGGHLRDAASRGRIWYADTDSIATDIELPTGDQLGQLKNERTVQESALFLRPKLYRVDDKVKAKGFPRLGRADFDELVRGGSYQYTRMLRLRESLGLQCLEPSDHPTAKKLGDSVKTKRAEVNGGEDTFPWDVSDLAEKAPSRSSAPRGLNGGRVPRR